MNWQRIVLGGLAAGIVGNMTDFLFHGVILGPTYKRLPDVFRQVEASPFKFLAVALTVWMLVALLFAKTRASWGPGWKGGVTFGFYLGVAVFFTNFYQPLVIEGFPYYLSWCWGGTAMIGILLGSAALGAIVPKEALPTGTPHLRR